MLLFAKSGGFFYRKLERLSPSHNFWKQLIVQEDSIKALVLLLTGRIFWNLPEYAAAATATSQWRRKQLRKIMNPVIPKDEAYDKEAPAPVPPPPHRCLPSPSLCSTLPTSPPSNLPWWPVLGLLMQGRRLWLFHQCLGCWKAKCIL